MDMKESVTLTFWSSFSPSNKLKFLHYLTEPFQLLVITPYTCAPIMLVLSLFTYMLCDEHACQLPLWNTNPLSSIFLLFKTFVCNKTDSCDSYGLNDRSSRVRFPAGAWNFFSSPPRPYRLWVPPSLLYNGCQGLSLGVKRPRREANHSTPSSAEVKNAWSYTSTPQYAFIHKVILVASVPHLHLPHTIKPKFRLYPSNIMEAYWGVKAKFYTFYIWQCIQKFPD
jgi:hypothetical protein